MKYQAAILQSNGRTLSGNMLQDDEQYFEYGEDIAKVTARTIASTNYNVSQKGQHWPSNRSY